MIAQLIRFGSVGGVATAVHVLCGMIVQAAFQLSAQEANLAGFLAAVLVSYFGHARYTFEVDPQSGRQVLRFILLSAVGYVSSSATVWIIATQLGLGFPIAMVAVGIVVPAITYLAMRFWVFDAKLDCGWAAWSDHVLCALFSVAMLALMWGRMLNHDTAWYLVAARDWMGGAHLYVDLVEVNPPLNFYLTLPSLIIADLFGISDTNGQYAATSLLTLASLCWCSAILRSNPELQPERRSMLLVGMGAALWLAALTSFAQREHILTIFLLPWLLYTAFDVKNEIQSRICGAAFAAIGVCLKPHFILFPLAATVYICVRQRSLGPILSAENLTFLAVGLAYVGFVAGVHPAYLAEIVPIAVQVYGAYGAAFSEVVFRVGLQGLLLVLPAAVALATGYRNSSAAFFAVMAGAGLGSYLLQGTGFGYHAIPFLAFGLMACLTIMVDAKNLNAVVIAASCAVIGLAGMSVKRGFYENGPVAEIAQVAEGLGEVKGLMVLTTYVSAGPAAAIATGADWTSRYPANWLVPGAINRLGQTDCTNERETCTRLRDIAAKNRSDNIADILRASPDLLVVDRRPGYFAEQGFDWQTFMAEDPAWETLISGYDRVKVSERFIYFHRRSDLP